VCVYAIPAPLTTTTTTTTAAAFAEKWASGGFGQDTVAQVQATLGSPTLADAAYSKALLDTV